jgi:hypothetical protein
MTVEKMVELFNATGENISDNFAEIEHPIKTKFKRRDLCAFVKLSEIVNGDWAIISDAEQDKIYLNFDLEMLAEVITEEDIEFLSACGVFIDEDLLAMFV